MGGGQLQAGEGPALVELLGCARKEGTRGEWMQYTLKGRHGAWASSWKYENHPAKTFLGLEATVLAQEGKESGGMKGREGSGGVR